MTSTEEEVTVMCPSRSASLLTGFGLPLTTHMNLHHNIVALSNAPFLFYFFHQLSCCEAAGDWRRGFVCLHAVLLHRTYCSASVVSAHRRRPRELDFHGLFSLSLEDAERWPMSFLLASIFGLTLLELASSRGPFCDNTRPFHTCTVVLFMQSRSHVLKPRLMQIIVPGGMINTQRSGIPQSTALLSIAPQENYIHVIHHKSV